MTRQSMAWANQARAGSVQRQQIPSGGKGLGATGQAVWQCDPISRAGGKAALSHQNQPVGIGAFPACLQPGHPLPACLQPDEHHPLPSLPAAW